MGTLVPGSGLLHTSWRLLGGVLLAAWAAGLVYLLVRTVRSGGLLDAALALAVDPHGLETLAVVVAVAAVLWVGSIVLTANLSWAPRSRGAAVGGVAAAAAGCLAVALPGALAVRYLDVQAGLVSDVFAAATTPGPAETLPGRPPPAPVPTPAPDPWADIPRVNLVLLGSDAGPDRTGVRTDSMMVVSINTRTGDTLLIGVPRNLENVPIPESNPLHQLYPNGYNCGDQCLMNAIWTLGDSRPDLFPGNPAPGRSSTVDVLGAVTGLDLSRSVVVDLAGFRELVDAMGGVDVNVTERVCIACHLNESGQFEWSTSRHDWIEPGLQHLDGYHALWYARSRATSDDFSRMRRQRCVAGALLQQADPVRMLARYPAIARAVRDNVSVDIPTNELPAWVDLVERIQAGHSIRSLPLTNRVVDPANPDFGAIHALVRKALQPPPATASPTPSATGPGPSATRTGGPAVSSPSPTVPPDPTQALDLSATC